VYWWEGTEEKSIKDIVIRQLQFIGEDPTREGLLETPGRVIRSWSELYSGYKQDPATILKVFKDGACDEMVLLKNIEFYSTCEHHLLPFFGKAHIAYIPNGRVVGISKLARLLEVFARRLQIQERLGQQITETLMKELKPKGAACILEAQHFCMVSRGVQKQDSVMVTSSLKGVFLEKPEVRAEFMGLIR
jgi:GTP cyclohydrolase I